MRKGYMKKAVFFSGLTMLSSIAFSGSGVWDTTGGTSEMNYSGSNVGVGTSDPTTLFEVQENGPEPTILINNTGGIGGAAFRMKDLASSADWKFKAKNNGGFKIRDEANTQDVIVVEPVVNGSPIGISIASNGNVGIGGATTPSSALAVNGTITAKEINVTATSSSWPDYVFSDSYKLTSLNEVENFIKENRHLPGVPSESDISKNGISIGEMASLQMEKIEELTLYVIELQKQNEELYNKLEVLAKKAD